VKKEARSQEPEARSGKTREVRYILAADFFFWHLAPGFWLLFVRKASLRRG
jgi:hypothetical protein